MTGFDVLAVDPSDPAARDSQPPLPPSRQLTAVRVARFLHEAAAGRGRALVLSGEHGIGRTTLLNWAMARVHARFEVAQASGYAPGSTTPGVAVEELLRQLAPASGGPDETRRTVSGDAPMRSAEALLSALDGALRPVLIVVDDAQWLDTFSLDVLGQLGRRLAGRQAALLIAARTELRADTARPLPLRGLPGVVLDRFDDDEAVTLLSARLPATGRTHHVADVVRSAAGNPLALDYFAAGTPAAAADGRADLRARLIELFAAELDALGAEARGGLEQAAVWLQEGDGADALPPACTQAARAELEAAGMLVHKDGRWCLGHPLLAPAALVQIGPTRLREVHAGVAAALEGDEDPAAMVRRMRHRVAAADGPDNPLAAELEIAARNPVLDLATAGRLLISAAELSSGRAARLRRLLGGLDRLQVAGCLSEAFAQLNGARGLARTALERAALADLSVRAEAMSGRPIVARDTLLRLAAATSTHDPVGAAERYARSAVLSVEIGEPDQARVAMEAANDLASPSAGPVSTAVVGLIASLTGRSTASSDFEAAPDVIPGCAAVPAGWALALSGRLPEALHLLESAADTSRRLGKDGLLPAHLVALSGLRLASGRVSGGLAAADEALLLSRSIGASALVPRAQLALARAEAVAGRERECKAHVADAMDWCRAAQDTSLLVQASGVLGFLALSLGQPAEAVAQLEANPQIRLVEDAVLPWPGDLIEALIRLGARRQASALLAEMEELQAPPSALRCAIGRGRGLLAGDPDEAVAHLVAALRLARESGLRLEEARALTVLGEVLAAQGSADARRSILAGAALFDSLGAVQWRARAGRLLRETARPAAPPVSGQQERTGLAILTPQELSVARVVADGLTNQQAASSLFVSVRTVEFHLSNAYRKLQVIRRSQLVRLVTAARDGEA